MYKSYINHDSWKLGLSTKNNGSHRKKSANDVLEFSRLGLPSILLLAREETGLARFHDRSLAEGFGALISFEATVVFLRCVELKDFDRMS